MYRLLVLLVAILPVISAAPVLLLEDPSGDSTAYLFPAGEIPLGIPFKNLDLRDLFIEETPDNLIFTVHVEALDEEASGVALGAGDVRIHFFYGEVGYAVQTGMTQTGTPYGLLHRVESDGALTTLGFLESSLDKPSGEITAIVPRDLIVDENGAPPIQNRELHDIDVRGYHWVGFGFFNPQTGEVEDFYVLRDQMPDGLQDGANYTFLMGGLIKNGLVELDSPQPYRASNGGAGVFQYKLELTNLDSEDHDYLAQVTNTPPTWGFEYPSGAINVAAGQTVSFPVVITTPTGHEHGGSAEFAAGVMQVGDPDTYAGITLGITYLEVPQPAGHHNQLFIHSEADENLFGPINSQLGGVSNTLYMNTKIDDPGDQAIEVSGRTQFPPTPGATYRWNVCLAPELLLGIDANMTQIGAISLPFKADSTLPFTKLYGEINHISASTESDEGPQRSQGSGTCLFPDNTQKITKLMGFEAEPSSVGPGGYTAVGDLMALGAGDYVPYEKGANLRLDIFMTIEGTSPAAPRLTPGGQLRLPLNEFFDEKPAGLVGSASIEPANLTTDVPLESQAKPVKESPGLGGVSAIAALAAISIIRRRRI